MQPQRLCALHPRGMQPCRRPRTSLTSHMGSRSYRWSSRRSEALCCNSLCEHARSRARCASRRVASRSVVLTDRRRTRCTRATHAACVGTLRTRGASRRQRRARGASSTVRRGCLRPHNTQQRRTAGTASCSPTHRPPELAPRCALPVCCVNTASAAHRRPWLCPPAHRRRGAGAVDAPAARHNTHAAEHRPSLRDYHHIVFSPL